MMCYSNVSSKYNMCCICILYTQYIYVYSNVLSVSCLSDEAAAEDKVTFTLGKKQSKLEALMTKEEMEEEQRSVQTVLSW